MVQTATVIDNASFSYDGTIEVMIDDELMIPYDEKDLSRNPSIISEAVGNVASNGNYYGTKKGCRKVYVASPMGGGIDYGVFHLPQINERGLVSVLNDPKRTNAPKYVWLCSIYEPDSTEDASVGIPCEDYNEIYGVNNGYLDDNGEHKIILKQRSTKLSSLEDPESCVNEMDWQYRPLENIAVLDESKIKLKHYNYNGASSVVGSSGISDDESTLILNNGLELSVINNNDESDFKLIVDGEKNLEITNNHNIQKEDAEEAGTSLTISSSINGIVINIYDKENGETSSIVCGPNELTVTRGNCLLQMNGKDITIQGDKEKGVVRIDAKKIELGSLGGTGGRVAVAKGTTSPGAAVQETVASENVFA